MALVALLLRRDEPEEPPAALPASLAAGDSAANIPLNERGKQVLIRWVARASGTLSALHLRIQADGSDCRRSGKTGYGDGNGGSWRVTQHPVRDDGRPDTATTLASQELRPCDGPRSVVDVREGTVRLTPGVAVVDGHEYATVLRNTDPDPARNYTSPNFLYTSTGLLGANARNERSADAGDAYYGLDPRELVGYSADAGRTWDLPTGSYPGRQNYLPTYIQEFADGRVAGQPYYYAWYPSKADRTMVFGNTRRVWTIRGLGAFTLERASGTLTLTVDGRPRARAAVSGTGMLRVSIPATTVRPGQVVRVTSTGLPIRNLVADTAWARLMGLHLPSAHWHLAREPNFSHAAPVYPLPACEECRAPVRAGS